MQMIRTADKHQRKFCENYIEMALGKMALFRLFNTRSLFANMGEVHLFFTTQSVYEIEIFATSQQRVG